MIQYFCGGFYLGCFPRYSLVQFRFQDRFVKPKNFLEFQTQSSFSCVVSTSDLILVYPWYLTPSAYDLGILLRETFLFNLLLCFMVTATVSVLGISPPKWSLQVSVIFGMCKAAVAKLSSVFCSFNALLSNLLIVEFRLLDWSRL